jgi:hypothetical protein
LKTSNLISLIAKDFTSFTVLSHPLQTQLMDVVPQLDLKLSNTRWSKYSEGHLQTLPTAKKEER